MTITHNVRDAIFVKPIGQVNGFRVVVPEPLDGQETIELSKLMNKIFPTHETDRIRVRTKQFQTFDGPLKPLAYQKWLCFQTWDIYFKKWIDHATQYQRPAVEDKYFEGGKNFRVVYFNMKFLIAWKYCNELWDKDQTTEDHLFLMRVGQKLLTQADLGKTMVKWQTHHTLYAFDENNMRPHYPMESDYAATIQHKKSKGILSESLKFHGKFA